MIDVVKETSFEKYNRLGNYQWLVNKISGDDLEIEFVVNNILFDMELRGIPIPPQRKYLDNLKEHVRVIILNLCSAYSSDPEKYVGYLRRSGAYKRKWGYQGFQFGYYNLTKVTNFLTNYGYIEHELGYPSSEQYEGQISKMRATVKLIDLIERQKNVTPDMIITDTSHEEVIIVKGLKPKPRIVKKIIINKRGRKQRVTNTIKRKRKVCKTPDNGKVRKMRENVRFINSVIEQSEIKLDITDQELRELNVRLNRDDDKYKQAVDYKRKFLHRVFLDRRLDRGGRFYGPWYQNIYKEYRPKIMVNGAPVVEVDYSGYHPRILYALKGLSVPEDPYTLDDYPDSDSMRGFLKPFLLMIINAKKPDDAMDAIREANYKNEKRGEGTIKPPEVASFSRNHLRPVMDKLIEKHNPISEYLFSGFGDTLQWIDSQIAEIIMLHFSYQGFPCLPVHDSFIVDVRLGDELEEIMEEVFVHNFKEKIPVKDNLHKYLFTPEFISKHREEWENRITEGLADGTIDLDEFMETLRKQKKRTKEYVRFANELKKSLDSK